MSDVTRILEATEQGDPKAADELLPLVYEELRKLAVVRIANEKPGQTLQPTALVHEAWLKVAGERNERFANRRHFFKAAAGKSVQISGVISTGISPCLSWQSNRDLIETICIMTEREIFFEALEMNTPEARAAYLQGACGRDVSLRRKVDELLKEHFSND